MSIVSVTDVQPRAQKALAGSPVHALRDLRVYQSGDTLQLFGHVRSFYHKQLAQEAVLAVAEGVRVVNSIDVN